VRPGWIEIHDFFATVAPALGARLIHCSRLRVFLFARHGVALPSSSLQVLVFLRIASKPRPFVVTRWTNQRDKPKMRSVCSLREFGSRCLMARRAKGGRGRTRSFWPLGTRNDGTP
jgi:hypothetical protein